MRRSLAGSLLVLAPLAAAADTIDLVNGDKLSGDLIEQTAERVVLDHPVLGRVESGLKHNDVKYSTSIGIDF
jgi:hypothetical protein